MPIADLGTITAEPTDPGPGLVADLAPHVSGRKPFTYLAPGENTAATFAPSTLSRLRTIKRHRDPNGVFRSNSPVLAETRDREGSPRFLH